MRRGDMEMETKMKTKMKMKTKTKNGGAGLLGRSTARRACGRARGTRKRQ